MTPTRTRPPVAGRAPLLRAAAVAAVAALFAAGGCNLTEPSPFDPRAMQRPGVLAAAGAPTTPPPPLPTTLQSPFLEGRDANGARRATTKPGIDVNTGPALGTDPTVRMTLQEILQRTVANNGEIRVAGYTPAIDQARVIEAEARFDPTLFFNTNYDRRELKSVVNVANDQVTTYSVNGGVRQLLQSGGQVELRYETALIDRSEPSPNRSSFNPDDTDPSYQNQLVLQLQQPLLRDFGNEVNRARIEINRRNQQISLLEFRKQLEETLAETEQTYWQLVQAEREVRIQENLLQRTIDTAFILLNRGEQDVTRVQLSQANASVEQRRSELIEARARVRNLSDQLKRAMQDSTVPPSSSVVILPAAPPVEIGVEFDRQEVIQQAYLNRLEIGQQQLRIDNAEIASRVAKNNLLPQLNLQLNGTLQGVGGQFIDPYNDQFYDWDNYSYTVALAYEIPIGNRAARSIYQRAMLQRMQAIEQYRSLLAQVDLEVSQAIRGVETSFRQIGATRQSRYAAADALASIERREEGGEPLTPTFVQLKLDRQEALAQAARQEVSAVSAYNIALSRLELAKGTLLRYNNIILEEEQMPFVRTMGYNGR